MLSGCRDRRSAGRCRTPAALFHELECAFGLLARLIGAEPVGDLVSLLSGTTVWVLRSYHQSLRHPPSGGAAHDRPH
jgi:hypothetical protein